jgi:UDP-glucuronate 4-epimerase
VGIGRGRGRAGTIDFPALLSGLRRNVAVRLHDGDLGVAATGDLRRRVNGRNGFHGNRRDLTPGRRYLVTGCAGFIGSHLTQALTARGCSVVGVDSFTDNYSRSVKERNLRQSCAGGDVRFAELDLAEHAVEPLMDRVDGVFHLAARPGVRTSWGPTFEGYLRDNLLVTQRVFEAAVAQGIRVVYASSSSIYGDADDYPLREDAKPLPVSPYGVSKLACEGLANAYARSAGLDAVGLRYFSVYGPRQRPDMAFARVFECLAANRPFSLLGNGRQTRDFTYVGDIVDGTLRAMERATSGYVYNIGGGSEISLLDSLTLCEDVVGRRLDIRHVPAATGDARRTIADIGQASADLGWSPSTSLEAGLFAQGESVALPEAASPKAAPALAWAEAS